MVETTVVRTIRVRGTSEGIDKLTGDLGKLAGAQENVAVVSENAARRTLSVQEAWRRQTMAVDESARSQARIARETKIADAAQREGLINQTQHAERLQVITQRYGQVIDATQKFGTQTGLARHELINLGRQAQDVGVSLVSGQSPLMILAQQGSQIADVFISSGKSVGSFFTQAIGWATAFAKTPAGIVTGIAAIGAAAVYAASQFVRASKTVEEALEEQNRLLKEGKALVDARTSAEARAQLQPKELTQFEMARNLLDLQTKLNKAREEAELRVSRPTEVPGEMGVAPTAVTGLKEFKTAFDAMKAAQAAGMPGLKEYVAELGKIGQARPDLANTIEDMIKLARTGFELEQAEMRLRAISDAAKGVATNAQLAAVGLGSIAQFKLNNLQADQAREATERQAVATLKIAAAYPGMTVEAAKMLEAQSHQLEVARAVGQMAQIEAQHRNRIVELSRSMSESEAKRVADAERAVQLAQIEAQHQQTMVNLRGQLDVASQVTGIGQINAQYEATVASLTLQIGSIKAAEQAEMQRAIAIAQVNAEADHTLKTLQQENQLINASSDAERDRIAARQTYQNLLDKGVDSQKASAVASQQLRNSEDRRFKAEREAGERAVANIRTREDAWEAFRRGEISWSVANDEAGKANARNQQAAENAMIGQANAAHDMRQQLELANAAAIEFTGFLTEWHFQWNSIAESVSDLVEGVDFWRKGGRITQFNPAGYTSTSSGATSMTAITRQIFGEGGFDPNTGAPNAQGLEFTFNRMLTQAGGNLQAAVGNMLSGGVLTPGALGAPPALDTNKLGVLTRAMDLLPNEQQAGALQTLIGQLKQAPASLQTSELIKQLNDKLQQLTDATNQNTDATNSMTDVLSPFYSSDPRRTYLGFRAFAEGGIMTAHGAMPLDSGIATSRQVAVFGEGSTPEAFVPAPAGRIPVEVRMPANSNTRPITVNINVAGNADADTVNALKQTAFQQAQTMRRVMR